VVELNAALGNRFLKPEIATEQVIVRPVRVPGTVQLDERRIEFDRLAAELDSRKLPL